MHAYLNALRAFVFVSVRVLYCSGEFSLQFTTKSFASKFVLLIFFALLL